MNEVYRFYNECAQLLHVSTTVKPETRAKDGHDWWGEVHLITVRRYQTEALQEVARAIKEEDPLYRY